MPNIEVNNRRKQLIVAKAVYRNDTMYASQSLYTIPRGTVLSRTAQGDLSPYDTKAKPPEVPIAVLTEDYVQVNEKVPLRVLVGGLVNLEALKAGGVVPSWADVYRLKTENIYAVPEIPDAELDNQ